MEIFRNVELDRGAIAGTAVFIASAIAAVVFGDGWAETVFVVVSLVLFVVGAGLMLAAFAIGVGRSRTEEVNVGGLFLLMGTGDKRNQRLLLGLTALQTVVAVSTASLRPFTALAFGILVPMFGLGIAAVWGALHGEFEPRKDLDHKRPEHARPTQGEDNG